MAFLKTKDLKNYTVQSLRGEVRKLIKEANRIIYELDESKKAGYMRISFLTPAALSNT